MDTIAATATTDGGHISPYLVLTAAALVVAAWKVFTWWRWPYKPCWRCEGLGRFKAPGGRAWRNCRRCKGSGSRIRTGRRILNAWRKRTQAA